MSANLGLYAEVGGALALVRQQFVVETPEGNLTVLEQRLLEPRLGLGLMFSPSAAKSTEKSPARSVSPAGAHQEERMRVSW